MTTDDPRARAMLQAMRMLQMSDSAFPVGAFSHSNGLETAAYEKVVTDRDTLREFARSQAWQAATTDGIAALHAYRCALKGDFSGVCEADRELMECKMNHEARLMLSRMGKKLAELAVKLLPDSQICSELLQAVKDEATPGSYPVVQGVVFAAAGVDEVDLFASHQYGVVNMVLGASLRCVRVSHIDTQEILFELSEATPALYEMVRDMGLDEIHAFYPELDILASMHEKGNMRMFMN